MRASHAATRVKALRQQALRARCTALTLCGMRMVPAPGVRNAVWVAADVGRASGGVSWSARKDSGTVRATPLEEEKVFGVPGRCAAEQPVKETLTRVTPRR